MKCALNDWVYMCQWEDTPSSRLMDRQTNKHTPETPGGGYPCLKIARSIVVWGTPAVPWGHQVPCSSLPCPPAKWGRLRAEREGRERGHLRRRRRRRRRQQTHHSDEPAFPLHPASPPLPPPQQYQTYPTLPIHRQSQSLLHQSRYPPPCL